MEDPRAFARVAVGRSGPIRERPPTTREGNQQETSSRGGPRDGLPRSGTGKVKQVT
jgi:hypothetical protein